MLINDINPPQRKHYHPRERETVSVIEEVALAQYGLTKLNKRRGHYERRRVDRDTGWSQHDSMSRVLGDKLIRYRQPLHRAIGDVPGLNDEAQKHARLTLAWLDDDGLWPHVEASRVELGARLRAAGLDRLTFEGSVERMVDDESTKLFPEHARQRIDWLRDSVDEWEVFK